MASPPQIDDHAAQGWVALALAEILGMGVGSLPRGQFAFYDAIREEFWNRIEGEFRATLEAELQNHLEQTRQVQQEELAHYRESLRLALLQQIEHQLLEDEAGVRAVESARDIITERLLADPETWLEFLAPPSHWWGRKQRPNWGRRKSSGMTGVG